MKFLQRMGIHDLHLEDVALLMEGPNAITSSGCPEHLQRMISEFHRDTFFILDGDSCPIRTERGTRPGDGFADVLWSLVFGRWLKDVEATLQQEEIFQFFPWNGAQGMEAGPGPLSTPQAIVAWADDIVLMADTEDAEKLPNMVRKTTEIVVNRLLSYKVDRSVTNSVNPVMIVMLT